MRRITYFFLIIPLLVVACRQGDGQKESNPSQNDVDRLTQALKAHGVGNIEILNIPDRAMSQTAISPASLENEAFYKLTIRRPDLSFHYEPLVQALASVTVRPADSVGDIRWGVIFRDAQTDATVATLYFDRSGQRGAVNNSPVFFNGRFFQLLKHDFSECFQ